MPALVRAGEPTPGIFKSKEWLLFVAALLVMAAALFGAAALWLQLGSVVRHVRETPRAPTQFPGISILKPLCGVDDDLERNLECFAALSYPCYEVVLGVKDSADPAYAVAQRAVERWPERMRLALQRSEPGFNPKVNQLVTLEAAARHDILVVSDSNTRAHPDYLQEVAAHFEDPTIACVSHPVSGTGERTLGSILDNLYMATYVAPGMISAKRVAGKDLVVGKSMAIRRKDLEQMGGFLAMKDYLAEDYVIGKEVTERLHKRVAICVHRIQNISIHKSVRDFYARYARWMVVHRTAVDPTTYAAQAMLNPGPLALLAFLAWPHPPLGWVALGVAASRTLVDILHTWVLRGSPPKLKEIAALPLKDALLFALWVQGMFQTTVVWRGNRLRACTGSRLVLVEQPEAQEQEEPSSSPAARPG
jgi:ceramide glucosyltransferase